jgi:hypothetical protein
MFKQSDLRSYQQRISTHLYENDSAFVIARPGGGKTAAALTSFLELKRDGVVRAAVVMAPKRVALNVWPDEIKAWEHTKDITYAVLRGTPAQRLKLLATADQRDLTIIGLDNAGWLIEQMLELPSDHPLWDYLIIDEISKLRNPTGVRSKLIANNAKRWKMIHGLSGTLRPSSALDLFMPARIVTRGALWGKSYYKWRQANAYATDFMQYDWRMLPGREDVLNTELAPYTVTLADGDMPELPALTVVIDRVDLPPDARAQYNDMQKKLFAELEDGESIVAASKAIATGKLAQIANGFLIDTAAGTTNMIHDAKREWLQDLLEDTDENMMLIYEYLADLAMFRDLLGNDLPYLGGGVSDAKAQSNIERWNRGELRHLAVHPKSAGHGLNAQHGGALQPWVAPTWSAEGHEQTIARLHRSGQKRPVVVRLCVATDTVDELKLARVHFRMSEQEAFEQFLQKYHARVR